MALGVPKGTKNELIHWLSDTMPLSYRDKQATLIDVNKIFDFGLQHPLYKMISEVGNLLLLKPWTVQAKSMGSCHDRYV